MPKPIKPNGKVILMIGGLTEGYIPFGPFDSYDEAFSYADSEPFIAANPSWVMECHDVIKNQPAKSS